MIIQGKINHEVFVELGLTIALGSDLHRRQEHSVA